MESILLDRTTLPILHRCDVTVIGGSFGGLAAALVFARAGRKVALIEPRTYLGREVTATLRPWIRVPAGAGPAPLTEPVSASIEASGTSATAGEFPLHMDAVKICLEDLLLSAGVKLIYTSLPVGLCTAGGRVGGVTIANKSGRQVVVCSVLLDATETALVARLGGAEFEGEPDGDARFWRTLEFDNVAPLEDTVLAVPSGLGLAGDRVVLHRGWHDPRNLLVECELGLPAQSDSAIQITRREVMARRRTINVAAYLMAMVPAFEKAWLAAASHELWGCYVGRMAEPAPEWARPFESLAVTVGEAAHAPASSFAGPLAGVWCVNEAARVDSRLRLQLGDPVIASRVGAALAAALGQRWEAATRPCDGKARAAVPGAASPGVQALQVKEPLAPQRGRHYDELSVEPSPVPILCPAEVVVAGGGTSGATAAITAAREGMRTTVIDMNPGLGGTGTYGGVSSYWFGRWVGYAARVMALVDRMHDRLRHPRPAGAVPRWNIEAKAAALMEEADEAGVQMLLNAQVFGAVVEGQAVRGVVAATRTGPLAVLGQAVIDATGDGDVAAFAGAEHVYGSERDHAVMWYSLPQIARPGRTRNNFTSMVDVSNVEDCTRAVLAGRRRGEIGQDHDHGVYIAARESRHIRGDVLLTLTHQLLQQRWPDVVNIAFSNNDIKGQANSDWMRIGLISPNLEIEIPYRALLPRGLDNILADSVS